MGGDGEADQVYGGFEVDGDSCSRLCEYACFVYDLSSSLTNEPLFSSLAYLLAYQVQEEAGLAEEQGGELESRLSFSSPSLPLQIYHSRITLLYHPFIRLRYAASEA